MNTRGLQITGCFHSNGFRIKNFSRKRRAEQKVFCFRVNLNSTLGTDVTLSMLAIVTKAFRPHFLAGNGFSMISTIFQATRILFQRSDWHSSQKFESTEDSDEIVSLDVTIVSDNGEWRSWASFGGRWREESRPILAITGNDWATISTTREESPFWCVCVMNGDDEDMSRGFLLA